MIVSQQQAAEADILKAKRALNTARHIGDPLRIELAEAALNDTLDRYKTDTTDKTQQQKGN